MLFKRKETIQETKDRILKLTEDVNCGMLSQPMKAQVAVNELCHFFLGDDWYSVNSISTEQINTEIVYEIERKYKKFNKHKRRK